MSFADWTDEEHLAMLGAKNPTAHDNATAYQIEMSMKELQRRYLSRIAEETRRLNEATQSLKTTTEGLVQATEKVHREVGLLADSSKKMEKLTLTLKCFTVWLIIFAVVQIVIAAVQTWKMFHS